MTDRIEEIFQQVIDEDCSEPLRRFAELVAADERNKFCTFLMQLHKQYKHQHNHFHVAAVNMWEQACGGRCNAENNPCEYKEAALELEGLKPVAWVKQDVCEDQFVEGRVRRVWWECNTGVGQPLYTTPVKQTPVAWRKKVNGIWHYFDESTPFPFDDCEPLYEKH